MFKTVLAKTVSRIQGTESDPDGTLRSPPCAVRRGHIESARWATRWCHFHLNGQTWPLLLRRPRRRLAQRTRWGDLLPSPISRPRRSPQGHAKGTPTYPSGRTPALSRAFSEPNPADGYVWEMAES
jgi:hypothetical protein